MIQEKSIFCFFDLDNTLIKGQSQYLFLRYLAKKGKIKKSFFIKAFLYFLGYKLGAIKNFDGLRHEGYLLFRGFKMTDIQEDVEDFFTREIKPKFYQGSIEILKQHINKGHKVVLISASFMKIVECVAKYLGIEKFIGTEMEYKDGIYTGIIKGVVAYGKQKAALINERFNGEVDFNNSYAYSDHMSDFDFLKLFGNVVVINPDPGLKKMAKLKKWNIYNFKK